MTSVVVLKEWPEGQRELLLTLLFNYKTQGGFIYNKEEHPVLCPYTNRHLRLDNFAIFPNGVIFEDSPEGYAGFFKEFPEYACFAEQLKEKSVF